jgi:hypothetical protein
MTTILQSAASLVDRVFDENFRREAPAPAASLEADLGVSASTEYVSEDYSYGYTVPAGGLPTHVSDGELLLWLEGKSQETYGRVREAMELSTARSKLMQDLTHLKGMIESNAPGEEVEAAINELRAAYVGTEFEADLAALLGATPVPGYIQAGPITLPLDGLTDAQEKALVENYQAQIDKLGRDDQLALVQIQDLMSNIREMSQLTSNLLASRDQASNTIVGNIRG